MEKVSGRAERQDGNAVPVGEVPDWLMLLDTAVAVQPGEMVETETTVGRCVTVTVWGLLASTAKSMGQSDTKVVIKARILGKESAEVRRGVSFIIARNLQNAHGEHEKRSKNQRCSTGT